MTTQVLEVDRQQPVGFVDAVYSKIGKRLLPLLFLAYIAAYLDRVNIGFAKLQLQAALQFSDTVYGLGAGVFFIGYALFEVPSNVMMVRIGARRWIARIMLSWGVISALTMFVTTPMWFYLLRFLLGVAEAGLFPGIILYLTYWYPAQRRAKAISFFLTGVAVAGIVGGPVSGLIMQNMDGMAGLGGWQWLFLLEALPSIILSVVIWRFLDDRVQDAHWLTPAERESVAREIALDSAHKHEGTVGAAFSDPRVWLLALVYFCFTAGVYGISFWLPTIVHAMGVVDLLNVGLLSAVPWLFGVVTMYLVARSADARREWRWHSSASAALCAVGLAMSVNLSASPSLAMLGLTLATMGALACLPTFWGMPTAFLGGATAAAGIALISSIGNLSGFAAPFVIGWMKDLTKSTNAGMYLLAGTLFVGALLALCVPRARATRP